MKRTTFLTTTLLTMAATPALAHTDVLSTSSLSAGLLHPFLGLDHILAMIAVGLLASQKGGKSSFALPLLFVLMMLIGGIFGLSAFTVPFMEQGILGSVIILGAIIAAGHRIPVSVAGLLVGFFALFHGFSHGTEMPVGSSVLVYGAGFATATLLLHISGFLTGRTVSVLASEKVVSNAYRIAGFSLAFIGFGLAAA